MNSQGQSMDKFECWAGEARLFVEMHRTVVCRLRSHGKQIDAC